MDNIQKFWPGWEIQETIGKGAFGTVYRIIRRGSSRSLNAALKVIRIPQSPAVIEDYLSQGMDQQSIRSLLKNEIRSLENEIQVMISLKSNTNIVSIEDYYIEPLQNSYGWEVYIRMELLQSLSNYLKTRPPLSVQEVAEMGVHLCEALSACESQKIIHRDIKPANIFRNSSGTYKLGDFGIARQLQNSSMAMTRAGTISYEAPELYLGHGYDHTVDIYSLGIVLYCYLNHGRKPFMPPYPQPITPQDNEKALTMRMKNVPLPEPTNGHPVLNQIVRKACSYSPEMRYQSALQMKQDLQRFLHGSVSSDKLNELPQRIFRETVVQRAPKQTVSPPAPSRNKSSGAGKTVGIIFAAAAVLAVGIFAWRQFGSGKNSSSAKNEAETGQARIETTDKNKDGIIDSEVEYNDAGDKIRLTYYDPKGKLQSQTIYEYDDDHILTRHTYYNQYEEMASYTVFDNDSSGKAKGYTTYDPDDRLWYTAEFEYAAEGWKKKETSWYDSGKQYRILEFDKSGNMIHIEYYNHAGELESYSDTEYYENGERKISWTYDNAGNLEAMGEFTDQGLTKRKVWYYKDSNQIESEFIYNEKEQQEKYLYYSKGAEQSKLKEYTLYEYDEKGNSVKETQYDPKDAMTGYTVRNYNKLGDEIKTAYYDPNGKVTSSYTIVLEYDEYDNRVKRVSKSDNGDYETVTLYEYNKKHQITKETSMNNDGTVLYYSVYTYDTHGDLLSYASYDENDTETYRYDY